MIEDFRVANLYYQEFAVRYHAAGGTAVPAVDVPDAILASGAALTILPNPVATRSDPEARPDRLRRRAALAPRCFWTPGRLARGRGGGCGPDGDRVARRWTHPGGLLHEGQRRGHPDRGTPDADPVSRILDRRHESRATSSSPGPRTGPGLSSVCCRIGGIRLRVRGRRVREPAQEGEVLPVHVIRPSASRGSWGRRRSADRA